MTEIKWFIKQLKKSMILENLKQYVRAFGGEIKNNVINEDMANDEQNELIKYIEEFSRSTRPNNTESKQLKKEVLDSANTSSRKRNSIYIQHLKAEYFRGLKNHKKEQDLKY